MHIYYKTKNIHMNQTSHSRQRFFLLRKGGDSDNGWIHRNLLYLQGFSSLENLKQIW